MCSRVLRHQGCDFPVIDYAQLSLGHVRPRLVFGERCRGYNGDHIPIGGYWLLGIGYRLLGTS